MPFDSHDLPPLPWSYYVIDRTDGSGPGHVYVLDANGRKIGSLWGKGREKIAMAELICDAADILKRQERNDAGTHIQDGKGTEDLGDRAPGRIDTPGHA